MFKTYILTAEVCFKNDDINCHQCPYLRPDRVNDRFVCLITNELIFKPKDGVDIFCPINFKEGE